MDRFRHPQLRRISLLSLALLALSLPFEVVLLRLGPLQATNLELLLALTLLLTGLLVMRERRWRERGWLRLPRAWLWLWAALAVAALLSALLAPEFQFNAAKASARLLGGMLLALAIPQLIRGPRQLLLVVLPLLTGALLAIGAGLMEVTAGQVLPVLDLFRITATSVGPFLRLTGSFSHANQAAMFLEATLPLLVALALLAWRHNWLLALGGAALILMVLQAAILTYSRASVATILLSHGAVAVLLWWQRDERDWSRALPWAALAGFVFVFMVGNALFNPVIDMRLRTEGDNEWYQLQFDVPESLTIDAGDTVTTTITVRNEGLLTWATQGPNQVRLGGHWYLPGKKESLAYVPRWPLPESVGPGEQIALQVPVRAPTQAGVYRLAWDMVHEEIIWFSYKNGIQTNTEVVVRENGLVDRTQTANEAWIDAALEQVVEAPPDLAPVPGRRTLWGIAAAQFLQHPLLGVGLDNFRLIYGQSLNYELWNDTIHTNNWYVEMLVSLGLLGALPFFAWVLLLVFSVLQVLRSGRASRWQAALAVALFAYFIHGLLDYFLLFNDTGLLFWLLTGLWISQEK